MARLPPLLLPGGCLLLLAAGLTGCGTSHPLPPYEPPLAHTRVQNVRTTAYTHTEADHLEYGNRNALGGTLHAASSARSSMDVPRPPVTLAVATSVLPATSAARDFRQDSFTEGGFIPPGSLRPVANVPVAAAAPLHVPGAVAYPATVNVRPEPLPPAPPERPTEVEVPTDGVGSAAADWSRWPAGTVFRIAATGQVYRVDDYGWALAGRNTIDLYHATRGAMNAWGVRRVEIEVLRWGDPEESLRRLRHHQEYRHIHRMVLELEGHSHAAAALE